MRGKDEEQGASNRERIEGKDGIRPSSGGANERGERAAEKDAPDIASGMVAGGRT